MCFHQKVTKDGNLFGCIGKVLSVDRLKRPPLCVYLECFVIQFDVITPDTQLSCVKCFVWDLLQMIYLFQSDNLNSKKVPMVFVLACSPFTHVNATHLCSSTFTSLFQANAKLP